MMGHCETLENQVKELDKLKIEIFVLKEERDDLSERIGDFETLKQDLSAMRAVRDALEEQLADSNAQHKQECDAMGLSAHQREQCVEELKAALSTMAAERDKAGTECATLKEELQRAMMERREAFLTDIHNGKSAHGGDLALFLDICAPFCCVCTDLLHGHT